MKVLTDIPGFPFLSKELRYLLQAEMSIFTKRKAAMIICYELISFLQQMTLWAIAKSPLMFGGDVRKLDDITFSLITKPTLLEINSFSSNNKEVCI